MALVTFTNVFLFSAVLRCLLITYSEWHDARSAVKYTDVDYRVFSDAARFLFNPTSISDAAQGTLGAFTGLGNPYERATYRYTPLLALLLGPNIWIHPSFGKYLFAACDLLNGWIIHQIVLTVVLPKSPSAQRNAAALAALHLLNPLVFTISTRGSSEAVLGTFILLTLYAALKGRWNNAAVLLGISTHWKIYPVVYGIACLGVVGQGSLVNRRTIHFTLLSGFTFLALGAFCYLIWGYPFLHETYLYHLGRRDHRHNFAPDFYGAYLTYTTPPSDLPLFTRLRLLPQLILCLTTGLLFGRSRADLPFTWFVQTSSFVLLNPVCTAQYFQWYILLLPLIIPRLRMSWTKSLFCITVWFGSQAIWLSQAYRLEFLGEDVFFGVWMRSILYMLSHSWILGTIMKAYAAE